MRKISANESMAQKNSKHIGGVLVFIVIVFISAFSFSVYWNWERKPITDDERVKTIEDRKRLVELETELKTELIRMEQEIKGAVDY